MKTLTYLIALLAVSFALVAPAHAEPWKFSLDASIMLNQSGYSDNWSGGEAGTVVWVSNINGTAEKQLHPKLLNKNTLKLAFGQTHKQQRETDTWDHPEKSTDLIDFESTFRVTLGSVVEPIVAFRALSQFVDYNDPAQKEYFNPAVLTETVGIARAFIKEEKREFITRLTAGVRQNIDRNRVDPAPTVEHDAGFEFVADIKTLLADDRIEYTGKLSVFQDLYYSESDRFKGLPEENYWKSPDINWENIFTATITKYLMVNLYTQLLYDKQIDKGGRFKQTLSLGLTYKFI